MTDEEIAVRMKNARDHLMVAKWELEALEAALPEGRTRDVCETIGLAAEIGTDRLGEELDLLPVLCPECGTFECGEGMTCKP
jgi:hypothetical protein